MQQNSSSTAEITVQNVKWGKQIERIVAASGVAEDESCNIIRGLLTTHTYKPVLTYTCMYVCVCTMRNSFIRFIRSSPSPKLS